MLAVGMGATSREFLTQFGMRVSGLEFGACGLCSGLSMQAWRFRADGTLGWVLKVKG